MCKHHIKGKNRILIGDWLQTGGKQEYTKLGLVACLVLQKIGGLMLFAAIIRIIYRKNIERLFNVFPKAPPMCG